MTFAISYTFEARDHFTAVARRISSSMKRISERAMLVREKMKRMSESMLRVGRNLTVGVTAPLAGFGFMAVKAAANMETMNAQYQSIFGSAKKAKEFTKKLIDFSARTPFRLKGVDETARELIHFDFKTKEIIPLLGQLGDAASGSGTAMENLASVYGRVHISGKLMGRGLRQLIYAKVPIVLALKEIAAKAGHAGANIQKAVTAGYVTAKVFVKAFKLMSSKGHMFYRQTLIQSKTMRGLWSTLLDNINLTLIPIGNLIIDTMKLKERAKELTEWLKRLKPKIEIFEKTHKTLAKVLIYLGLIGMSLGPIIISLAIIVAAIGALLSPITVVLVGIVALGAAFYELYQNSKLFRETMKGLYWLLKVTYSLVKIFVSAMMQGFSDLGYLVNTIIIKPILFIINSLKKLKNLFGSTATKTANIKAHVTHQITGTQQQQQGMFSPFKLAPQQVNSSMSIFVHDPAKILKGISSVSDGKMNYNTGQNMALSHY